MFIDSFGLFQLPAATCLWIAVDRLLVHVEPVAPACQLMEVALFVALVVVVFGSRWDRYLGMTAPMTQNLSPRLSGFFRFDSMMIMIQNCQLPL